MDFIGNLLAVIVVAILISSAFYYGLKARGPWGSFWSFFMVLLLIIWVTNIWVAPVGPVYYGVAWFPLVFAGLVIALLLAAIPTHTTHRRSNMYDNPRTDTLPDPKSKKEAEDTNRAVAVMSGIFWIFIIILLIAIIAGYMV